MLQIVVIRLGRVEQSGTFSVPQVVELLVERDQLTSQRRISKRHVEQAMCQSLLAWSRL